MFNKITHPENRKLKDINKREWALLLPITILIFWIGIYPKPMISRMDASVNNLLTQVDVKYKATLKKVGKSVAVESNAGKNDAGMSYTGKSHAIVAVVNDSSKSPDYIESEGRMGEPSKNPVERLMKLWK